MADLKVGDSAEVWKPVVGYEGDYEVSNMGRVRSMTFRNGHASFKRKKPMLMKIGWNVWGYSKVTLSRNDVKRTRTIHTLVMRAFVGPPPKGHEVAHLNGDRKDNRLCNLAYVTRKENHSHKLRHGTA